MIAAEPVTEISALQLYAELTRTLGKGESASLALAVTRGRTLACDERGAPRREGFGRIGAARLIGTADLLLGALHAGVLTLPEAGTAITTLAAHRFHLPIESFAPIAAAKGDQ